MPARSILGCVAFSVLVSGDARLRQITATGCGDSASVHLEPLRPVRGSLFRVRVAGTQAGMALSGSASGEPLHFMPDSSGTTFESLAPVPIDGPGSIVVVVACSAGPQVDSLTTSARTGAGDYRIERLQVAPAFGRPPDSATAARIEQESRRAVDVARSAHATPRLWNAPFAVPRDSRITSGFGHGREYNGAITSRHMGTDFAGVTGAPVKAANRGVVRIVAAFYYGGNVVYLDHGAGLTTAYLHMSSQAVAVGDTVERGQVIGRIGATGRVTGPHLHLIVRYGAVTVDPASLFAIAGTPSSHPPSGATARRGG